MTEGSAMPGGWKGWAVLFAVFAATFAHWYATGDDLSENTASTVRDRMAYAVAKSAFPYGDVSCHTAAASDLTAIIAEVDADMGEANEFLWYSLRDVNHEGIEVAVAKWLDGGPAAPYECAGLYGMRADALYRGVEE